MRLARLAVATVTATIVFAGGAVAQGAPPTPAHREAVARLLAVTHIRELTEQSSETVLAQQLKQMPQLTPYAGVLRDFYREQLAWSVLEPEYTQIYLEVFSEAEVRELVQFYETSLGQRMLAKMPMIMAKTNELTSRRMQAAMPQLMQRMQAAMQAPAPAAADSTPKGKP